MTPEDVEDLAIRWTGAQRAVAGLIRSLVPDFHDAEEVLQRVAVTLTRKFSQYDRSRPFAAWAMGMAKLEVLAYLRERRADRIVFSDALVDRIAAKYESAVSADKTPASQFIAECVDELDGRSRRAIQLRYDDNLPTAEIARVMQTSDGSVRMILMRARSLLRKCFDGKQLQ